MRNKAYVEITNVCNLSCAFCPGHGRPQGFLQPEAFGRILEQLRGQARQLYFHVMGEPLLHPQLGLLLAMAAEAGFPVNLTTNGTLLSKAVPTLAAASALRQINVSLHSDAGGAGPLIHGEALGRGHMAAALDAVAALRQARSAASLPLQVSLRLWNLRGDADANAGLIRDIAARFGTEQPLRDRQGWKLADRLWIDEGEVFDWPSLGADPCGDTAFCRALRDQLAILCDGTVTACCLDAEGVLALGNILEQPLEDILHSPRAQAIVEGFSQRRAVEPLCQRCGFRKRFDL